jgi:hypothetical protein
MSDGKLFVRLVSSLGLLVGLAVLASATPTGWALTPTADTVKKGSICLSAAAQIGHNIPKPGADREIRAAFDGAAQVGLTKNLEIGVDATSDADNHWANLTNIKWHVKIGDGVLALGAKDVTSNDSVQPYFVYSTNMAATKPLRVHMGLMNLNKKTVTEGGVSEDVKPFLAVEKAYTDLPLIGGKGSIVLEAVGGKDASTAASMAWSPSSHVDAQAGFVAAQDTDWTNLARLRGFVKVSTTIDLF